jgi:AmmeMemoRadiSam system protein A
MTESSLESPLTAADRAALLAAARDAIRCELDGVPFDAGEVSAALRQPGGAFVSLHKSGELRGCIGTLDDTKPLIESVTWSAVAAATRDHRFSRLSLDELARVDLEVSVLGVFREVSDPGEITVGRDGLYLRAGMASGILLPQVATERGWDRETFLDHLCLKAGIPARTWRRSDCVIERFGAEVFGEKD